MDNLLQKIKNNQHINVYTYPLVEKYNKPIVLLLYDILHKYNMKRVDDNNSIDINIIHITELINVNKFSMNTFYIIISGETWEFQLHNNNIMMIRPFITVSPFHTIYYPMLYMSLAERSMFSYTNEPKTKFCAFMYHMSYEHREEWFYKLSKLKRVDALGKSCNNVEIRSTRFVHTEKETYNDIAVKLYSEYHFVLAIENKWTEGYFTEKILNPIIANSIPLYWGHPYVFNYINKKRVIYLPEYSEEELFNYLVELENNQDKYNQIINENTYTAKGDPDNVFNTLGIELSRFFTF
jgi:hypothetical protein